MAGPAEVIHELPDLKKVSWFSAVKQTIQEFMADDAQGLAAEMSFRFVFALVPTFLVTLSLLAIFDNTFQGANVTGELLTLLQQSLPRTAYQVIESVIETTVDKAGAAGGIFTVGFVLAIWSASAGIDAVMKAYNVAYDTVETRNFIKKKLISLALTIGAALFLVITMLVLVFGGKIGEVIASSVGLGAAFQWAWNIGRIVLMVIVLIFALALLYYFAPNVNHKFVWISPGAIVAGLLWLIVTWAFSFYMNNWGAAGAPGVVGGFIALLSWMYYSSMVLLLGAEMNGVLGQKHDPETIADPRQKATGPNASTTTSGGRIIGAGANVAKGTPHPGQDASGAAAGPPRRGRHQDPNSPERRLTTGRQDPARVEAAQQKHRDGHHGGGKNGTRPGQNAQQPAAATVTLQSEQEAKATAKSPPIEPLPPPQEAPAKAVLWNMLHHGSTAVIVQGYRELLGTAWRVLFNTRPPAPKPAKKK